MMEDHKAKDRFCIEHYDQSDADFHELVKRTNWLKDPLVCELFRRLDVKQVSIDAQSEMDKFKALAASEINEATYRALEVARQKVALENIKLLGNSLEVEATVSPYTVHRKGRPGEHLPFMVDVIRAHGKQTKGALVAACLVEWPDRSRSAFSNTINRELKRKNGKLGLDLKDLIVLKMP